MKKILLIIILFKMIPLKAMHEHEQICSLMNKKILNLVETLGENIPTHQEANQLKILIKHINRDLSIITYRDQQQILRIRKYQGVHEDVKILYDNIKKVIKIFDQPTNACSDKNLLLELQTYLDDYLETSHVKNQDNSRDLNAQYIAIALNNLLPVISAIQKTAAVALETSASNPIMNEQRKSSIKKFMVASLCVYITLSGIIWLCDTSGLIQNFSFTETILSSFKALFNY